jgi:hypothetical protein
VGARGKKNKAASLVGASPRAFGVSDDQKNDDHHRQAERGVVV